MLSNFPPSPIVAHFVLCPAMLSQAVICDSCCRVAGLPQPPCSIASRLQMAEGLGASLTLNVMEQLATAHLCSAGACPAPEPCGGEPSHWHQ